MQKRGGLFPIIICFVIIFLIAFLIFELKPLMTGFAVSEEEQHEKNWDFNNLNDYNYNSSLIEITDGQVKLIPTTTQTYWNTSFTTDHYIYQAIYDSEDKTEKVNTLDDQFLEINKNKSFEIFFSENLENNYIISFYIKDGAPCNIYLCENGSSCNSPGYGSISFSGTEGFYNITLSGLVNPIKGFKLNSDKNYGINYLESSSSIIEEHNSTTTTYPQEAEIETNDLEVNGLKKFNLFDKEYILNNQEIKYYYSTDSGSNWNEIQSDDLTNIDTSNKKIKIKAKLKSNQTETPILEKVLITYSTQTITCTENWTEIYSECLINNTQLKTYSDINNCNTIDDLPSDNGTYVNCTYSAPEVISAPSSSSGGGSGGGNSNTKSITNNIPQKDNPQNSSSSEVKIKYDLETLFHDNSLVEKDYIEGDIINNGNTSIKKLTLEINQELEKIISIDKIQIENFGAGQKVDFKIMRKEKKKNNLITSLVTEKINSKNIINGYLILKIESQPDFEEKVPLSLEILNSEQIADKGRIVLIAGILTGIFGITAVGILIRKKFFKKKK